MINIAQILGRVGKINTKTTANGIKICNISMVTSKKFIKNNEKTEKVTWHNVALFSKLADIAEKYVQVGDLLYIQGEMDSDKFTDKSGIERMKFYVIGHELKLMPNNKEHKVAPKEEKKVDHYDAFEDDEIPW